MKRFETALLAGIVISVLLSSFGAFAGEAEETRENVVRLHIVANSDSERDQAVKLMVRDAVLEKTSGMFMADNKILAEKQVLENLAFIEDVARETMSGHGYDLPVKAELINMYFDTRQYGDIKVAAGWYDAVRITIGDGKGQNWWCVMFPPICLPAAEERPASPLEEQIENLGAATRYTPKFAAVELLEELQSKLNGRQEAPVTLP